MTQVLTHFYFRRLVTHSHRLRILKFPVGQKKGLTKHANQVVLQESHQKVIRTSGLIQSQLLNLTKMHH